MKKIISCFCILSMVLVLCACGDPGSGENGGSSNGGKPAAVEVQPYTIQANGCYTYGLAPDGTLTASSAPFIDGENVIKTLPDYTSWTNIRNFSSNSEAIAAVFQDGTVKMCGGLVDEMEYTDFSDVEGWTDVVQVAMGKHHLAALKADGSIALAGWLLTESLEDTTGFVQVEAGTAPMGVKSDGTVVVWDWSWDDPIDAVKKWTDITYVSSSWNHIVALKSDGTVVACGNNDFGQCDVDKWSNIVAVSAGCEFTIGLKSDGTVVFCGSDKEGAIDVSQWTDIAQIDAGYHHCAGLKSNGTVVCSGQNFQGQCNTDGWKLK